jgi:hypothetical protein
MTEHDNADEVTRLRAEVERVRERNQAAWDEIRKVRQGLWDTWEALGYDTDGDTGPGALIAGMGVDGFIAMVVEDAATYRRESEEDYANDTDALTARAESAEAALTRVRELAKRWEAAETWEGKPAMVDRGFGARLMLALDPASPATRPSPAPAVHEALTVCVTHLRFVPCRKDGEHRTSQHPDAVAAVRAYQDAPADDEGTGTGAAPSEGHSEDRCCDCPWCVR